jgi:hypothetical protein
VREKKKMMTNKNSKDKKVPATPNVDGNSPNSNASSFWTVFSEIAMGAFIPGVWNLVKIWFLLINNFWESG